MQFQIILHISGEKPYAFSVDMIASHLTVSKAFFQVYVKRASLGCFFPTISI